MGSLRRALGSKKAASRNPKGRPKRVLDLDGELIKEFNSSITIKDNGKRRSISKIQGIVKQMTNKAVTGDIRAARIVLAHYQQILERAALSEAKQPTSIGEMDVKALTDQQLIWIAAQGLPEPEEEK